MAIDAVWAGVVGTVAGGVVGSATSLLAPLINWRTEEKRLGVEKHNAKDLADHQHTLNLARIERESAADELAAKRALVCQWREGVAASVKNYHEANAYNSVSLESLAGAPWFETLRPHLNSEDVGLRVDFLAPIFVEIYETKAKNLSDEITRIAREWNVFE